MRPPATAAAFAVALALFGAQSAAAQDYPAGDVTAALLIAGDDIGGGLLVDVGYPIDWFRIGGAIGVGAVSSSDDARSRVFMPVSLWLGAVLASDEGVWFDLRARGGFWAGATNQGLEAGPFVAPGIYIGYGLSEQVAVEVGVEGWFLFLADRNTFAVAPSLSLSWTPPPNEE